MSNPDPALSRIIQHVLSSAAFWAPEVKAQKLVPYLGAHPGLYEALMARSKEERGLCGVDQIVVTEHAL